MEQASQYAENGRLYYGADYLFPCDEVRRTSLRRLHNVYFARFADRNGSTGLYARDHQDRQGCLRRPGRSTRKFSSRS